MRAALLLLMLFATLGCGAPSKRARLDDQTRRVAPLPACVFHLPPRRIDPGAPLRPLREEQIVKLLFPTFDEEKRALPANAPLCTGRAVLADPLLAAGTPVRGAFPWTPQEGDVLYGSGGDRMRIVWARMLTWPDGTAGGPLALVRGGERFAELFAAAPYRGHPERVKLGTARMGTDVLVTAEEDRCAHRKPGTPCETTLSVFLPRGGVLARVVDVPVERVAYAAQGERGSTGTLEYRLTAVAEYKEDGVHVVEQIRVTDDAGTEVRKGERVRVFALNEAGLLTASGAPLWDSVVKSEKRDTPARSGPRKP